MHLTRNYATRLFPLLQTRNNFDSWFSKMVTPRPTSHFCKRQMELFASGWGIWKLNNIVPHGRELCDARAIRIFLSSQRNETNPMDSTVFQLLCIPRWKMFGPIKSNNKEEFALLGRVSIPFSRLWQRSVDYYRFLFQYLTCKTYVYVYISRWMLSKPQLHTHP